MVPKAEEEKIAEAIQLINKKSDDLNIVTTTKIFEGQSLPVRPNTIEGKLSNITLYLGEVMGL